MFGTRKRVDKIAWLACGTPRSVVASSPWAMLTAAYIDDSGTGLDTGLLVLAGYIATIPAWEAFTGRWEQALAVEPSIPRLHMKEAFRRKGTCAEWTVEDRDARLGYLAGLISCHALCSVAVAIPVVEYERVYGPRDKMEHTHPYMLCFYSLISGLLLLKEEMSYTRVNVVWDMMQQHKEGMNDSVRALRGILSPEGSGLLGSVHIPDTPEERDTFVPLQAADMLAWHTHRNAKRGDDDRMPVASLLLDTVPRKTMTLNREYLEAHAREVEGL